MRKSHPAYNLIPQLSLQTSTVQSERRLPGSAAHSWVPFLISSSEAPANVAAIQAALGRERAGNLIELAFAAIAPALVEGGVRRIVVAGGETSGAVVKALGVRQLAIGPPIEPGVPATFSLGEPGLALALKSGNFGGDSFFLTAIARLQ